MHRVLMLSLLAASAAGGMPDALHLPQGLDNWSLFLALALGTLITEDLTCIAAGLLVVEGRLDFTTATSACLVGILVGDVLLFFAGRWLGRPALTRAPLRWFLSPQQVDAASGWIHDNGAWVILSSRFVPGTRLPVYFAMGSFHAPFLKFFIWFFVAVLLWTPLLVGVTVLLGERALAWFDVVQRHTLPALIVLGLLIWLVVDLGVPLLTRRGRRMLVGRWRRWKRWEFWPAWLFYAPLMPYLLFLGIRHRSPLVFTAANPAMPAGGFISEPKHEIIHGLAHASEFVAQTRLLPAGQSESKRREAAQEFMAEASLDFPVVLKPDKGQRGAGVHIIRDETSLHAHLEAADYDLLLQEYVPGHEFGLFYGRLPGTARGRVFSITEKRMPVVTGDGQQTLEQLILHDERAVCVARVYLDRHRAQLDRVPAAGETVQLVELGTHCQGAVFLDGAWLWSDALEARIDAISRGYEGFWFGRYDLRAADLEALRAGEGFRIVELNGVTSEATHVYDPGNALLDAYRALGYQWRLAFRIGAANRARGAKVYRIKELCALWWQYQNLAVRYKRAEIP